MLWKTEPTARQPLAGGIIVAVLHLVYVDHQVVKGNLRLWAVRGTRRVLQINHLVPPRHMLQQRMPRPAPAPPVAKRPIVEYQSSPYTASEGGGPERAFFSSCLAGWADAPFFSAGGLLLAGRFCSRA